MYSTTRVATRRVRRAAGRFCWLACHAASAGQDSARRLAWLAFRMHDRARIGRVEAVSPPPHESAHLQSISHISCSGGGICKPRRPRQWRGAAHATCAKVGAPDKREAGSGGKESPSQARSVAYPLPPQSQRRTLDCVRCWLGMDSVRTVQRPARPVRRERACPLRRSASEPRAGAEKVGDHDKWGKPGAHHLSYTEAGHPSLPYRNNFKQQPANTISVTQPIPRLTTY